MSEEPRWRIRGKLYAYPSSSKLGDAALIEQLTGLTHSEWRKRYKDSLLSTLAEQEEGGPEAEEDTAVTIGVIALAVARGNPRWPRVQVVEFVNDLDWEEIVFEGGDADPPESGAKAAPSSSQNGTESVSQSSSDSDTDSNKSTIQPISGKPTSVT